MEGNAEQPTPCTVQEISNLPSLPEETCEQTTLHTSQQSEPFTSLLVQNLLDDVTQVVVVDDIERVMDACIPHGELRVFVFSNDSALVSIPSSAPQRQENTR